MNKYKTENTTSKKPITLYLHAGTHKTGTTAIQSFAAVHKRALLRRGLLYPGFYQLISLIRNNQIAHHWFAHAIADKKNIPLSAESIPNLTGKWLHKAVKNNADLFISAEALYRHVLGGGSYEEKRKRYLRRVAGFLEDFDVHVILVFRRPDDYIRSLYQERVMRAAKPLPGFRKFYQSGQQGLEYSLNARLMKEVFPRMSCLIYEDLYNSDNFFGPFFNVMHVDVTDLDGVGVVRKSLSPAETRVKNFANRFLENRDQAKLFLRWMRKPKAAARIQEAYGDTEYDLWPGHEARKKFLDSREEDIENLRREFFPDRERLFPPLEKDETLPRAPELPEDLKKMIRGHFGKENK